MELFHEQNNFDFKYFLSKSIQDILAMKTNRETIEWLLDIFSSDPRIRKRG